jgi:hypothetical protein
VDNSFSQAITGWQGFYALAGAASATLVGLLFIAVSLHLDIFSDESETEIRSLAENTLINFLSILMIALFFLIPHQSPAGLGLPLLIVAIGDLGRQARDWFRHVKGGLFKSAQFRPLAFLAVVRVIVPVLYQVTTILVAIAVLSGQTDPLYWLVWVIISILLSASMNAWGLMIRLSVYRQRLSAVNKKVSDKA